jgi:hypothetical protein
MPPSTGCGRLIVRSDDGKFLGVAVSNEFAVDGVCNKFSPYGSEFGADSIFNKFGTYGGEFSPKGAYNKFAFTPPNLACEGSGAKGEFVSKNTVLQPRIDPDLLCITLKQTGK